MRLKHINYFEEKLVKKVKKKFKKKNKKQPTQLDELIMIKGIGKETLQDIKRVYKSIDELKDALRKDTVPLRNDIVKKLKKKLLVR